jgi:hypothetical protein
MGRQQTPSQHVSDRASAGVIAGSVIGGVIGGSPLLVGLLAPVIVLASRHRQESDDSTTNKPGNKYKAAGGEDRQRHQLTGIHHHLNKNPEWVGHWRP